MHKFCAWFLFKFARYSNHSRPNQIPLANNVIQWSCHDMKIFLHTMEAVREMCGVNTKKNADPQWEMGNTFEGRRNSPGRSHCSGSLKSFLGHYFTDGLGEGCLFDIVQIEDVCCVFIDVLTSIWGHEECRSFNGTTRMQSTNYNIYNTIDLVYIINPCGFVYIYLDV